MATYDRAGRSPSILLIPSIPSNLILNFFNDSFFKQFQFKTSIKLQVPANSSKLEKLQKLEKVVFRKYIFSVWLKRNSLGG